MLHISLRCRYIRRMCRKAVQGSMKSLSGRARGSTACCQHHYRHSRSRLPRLLARESYPAFTVWSVNQPLIWLLKCVAGFFGNRGWLKEGNSASKATRENETKNALYCWTLLNLSHAWWGPDKSIPPQWLPVRPSQLLTREALQLAKGE